MVKCKDCGCLGARSIQNSAESVEAIEFVRIKGFQPCGDKPEFAYLYCHANSDEFPDAIAELNSTNDIRRHSNEIPPLLAQETNCQKFMKWQMGKSPKEHSEMEFLEKIQNEHRANRQEDIARQDAFEERVERRHREAQSSSWRQHASRLVVQFLIALLALATAFVVNHFIPFYRLPR